MKKHIVICGRRGVGKTTMIQRLLQELSIPVYGYLTRSMKVLSDGRRKIYMYPAGHPDGRMSGTNHIGDCNRHVYQVNTHVFDELGVRLLKEAKPDGIIVMDEIGFMETGSKRFCSEVLKVFDGDIPVLAAVKDTELGAEFLDRIRQHPSAVLYELTRDRFDEVYETLLPVVRGWNRLDPSGS